MSSTKLGAAPGHPAYVRITHAVIVLSVLVLLYSGLAILVAHPRLYWGQVGNSLTPTLIELPWGRNYHNVPFGPPTAFFGPDGPVTRSRLKEVANLNSWARSLHFLTAWAFLAGLTAYLGLSLASEHLQRDILPGRKAFSVGALMADIRAHLTFLPPQGPAGPPYNLLQKIAYTVIVCLALPLMIFTGLSMSPAITTAVPLLTTLSGGYQTARTLHFVSMVLIFGFILVHLAMVLLTGVRRQLRAILIGG